MDSQVIAVCKSICDKTNDLKSVCEMKLKHDDFQNAQGNNFRSSFQTKQY